MESNPHIPTKTSELPRSPLLVYAQESRQEALPGMQVRLWRYWLVFGALTVGLGAATWLQSAFGGLWSLLPFTAIAVGLFLYLNPPWPTTSRERAPWERLPFKPDAQARVACCGGPRALAILARHGPIDDRMLEPEVFFAFEALPSPHGRAETATWVLTTLLIGAAVVLLDSRIQNNMGWMFIGLFAVSMGGVVVGLLWPTYLRVAPGRLSVMRSGMFGRHMNEVSKADLRTGAVVVDLNARAVFVTVNNATTEVRFGAVRNPHAFAHALLLAAVSTHTPAPLPDDALVG